ncbi:MAG TPA: hypothetical protein VE219_06060 [Candidatus Sulfotelmatobacter sp.]|nr:hypothetical protein [Candidatus Sulfotelmatobacter sp.]
MTCRGGGEHGLIRGCFLGLALLAVIVIGGGYLGFRALATPDLGPPPDGADDGSSQQEIAATLAARIAAGLLVSPHTIAVVSERDLTVIARTRNPEPSRYQDPDARVRDGQLLLSAVDNVGPVHLTTVAHVKVQLQNAASNASRLVGNVTGVDVGTLPIPSWAREMYDRRTTSAFNLEPVLNGIPLLEKLRSSLECAAVAGDGLHLGFHRPGTDPQFDACG